MQKQSMYKNLSEEELLYLFQFIRYRTTLIEFNSTDPVVSILENKGFIYRSMSAAFIHTSTPRFRSNYDYGQPYEILPDVYQYLIANLDIYFGKSLRENKNSSIGTESNGGS